MSALPRVIVVEDEIDLAETIRDNLLVEGYAVDLAHDGDQAVEAARSADYDLMILDVMLPRRDGFQVCETLRREGCGIPVLFLTAMAEGADRIHGLEVGGDDYLPKPFHLAELLLRVEALLRRGGGRMREPRIRFGDNRFDLETGRAASWDGVQHQLGPRERQVLQLFLEHEGEALARDEILEKVWRDDVFPSTRRVDAIVARLRRIFEFDPTRPRHFHRQPDGAYRFSREPKENEVPE